jgi:hypothetical protein
MSSFAADWLSLREPFDARARNSKVRDAVVAALAGQSALSIVDLACGTGSTLRALADHLPARQNWTLVDNDLGLLARAADASHPRASVRTAAIDLARDLEAALDGPVDLVTTSALLDLVSERWLERLAVELAARKLPFYAALTFDGRITLAPSDPGDEAVIAAAMAFHRRDQGFGPALGPDAGMKTIAQLKSVGYAVTHGAADWEFGPHDRDIQFQTLESWAGAAREGGHAALSQIDAWLARRRELVAAARSTIRIGHVDVFADPIGLR